MQSDCNSKMATQYKMETQNEIAITIPYYEKQKHVLHRKNMEIGQSNWEKLIEKKIFKIYFNMITLEIQISV